MSALSAARGLHTPMKKRIPHSSLTRFASTSPLAQFGIVAGEASTSGAWFRCLPRLHNLLPPIDIGAGLEAEAEAARVEGRLPERDAAALARRSTAVLRSAATSRRESADGGARPSGGPMDPAAAHQVCVCVGPTRAHRGADVRMCMCVCAWAVVGAAVGGRTRCSCCHCTTCRV
jgi:hypothetical protein